MNKMLQLFKDLKFKKKLFLSYLVVIILPIGILGVFTYFQSESQLRVQAEQSIKNSVQKISQDIDNQFAASYNVIQYLAIEKRIRNTCDSSSPFFDNTSLDGIANTVDLIKDMINVNNNIRTLTIFVQEKIPEYSPYIRSVDSVKEFPWYEKIHQSKKPMVFYINGNLFIAHNIYNIVSNKILGVIYMKLDYNNFFESCYVPGINKYGILITDSEGNPVFSKTENLVSTAKDLQGVLQSSESHAFQQNGVPFEKMENSVKIADWKLYFYLPSSEISTKPNDIILSTVVVIFGCIIILLMIIRLFSNTFVKRINGLNKKVKSVEQHNMNVSFSSRSKDEIGELANGIATMMDRINHLIQEVYESRIIQTEAEIKALQAQINPHFLYNVLSTINWMAIIAHNEDISHITGKLSDFYRTTLNNGSNIIIIEQELQNTKSYIDIQLVMHKSSFEVHYSVDESILKYYMPNLILQPIVENAIGHGLDKRKDGGGVLEISGCLDGNCIEFVVQDNGPGITDMRMDDLLIKNSRGYGLKNVQDRLKLFFGREYGIMIHSLEGIGTKVTIRLPKHSKQ